MAQVPESPWEDQSDLSALATTKYEPDHFETAQALGPDVPATLLASADQGDQLEMAVSRGATAEMARTRPTFQRAPDFCSLRRRCCASLALMMRLRTSQA